MDLACIATNFTITVVPGTNAPVIMLNYPQNGMIICGSSFTIDGWLDNPTAGLMVTIVDTNGVTNAFSGLVERSGFVWAQTLAVTNQYMSTSQAPVSLNVSQGMACALAVLVDDTNLADATWTPYSASVTGNLVFTNGNPSRPFSSQGEFNMCHRAVENRPEMSDPKPATLRCFIHITFPDPSKELFNHCWPLFVGSSGWVVP